MLIRHFGEKFLAKASKNLKFLNFLENLINRLQYYIGIGSGSGVESSGEKVLFDKLKSFSAPLMIFDVGANQGQFSSFFLNNCSISDFTVHAFEPSLKTFEIFKKNINDPRIIPNNFGLGKENGEFELFSNEIGSGLASLTKRKLDHFNITFNLSEKIKIQTLDFYCEEKQINKIDLLKIDVEGHELDVLSGGSKILNSTSMISFEFGGCNIDTRTYFQDFYYFFKDRNFRIFRMTPSGFLFPIEQYKEIYEQFRTTNFLCIKNF